MFVIFHLKFLSFQSFLDSRWFLVSILEEEKLEKSRES